MILTKEKIKEIELGKCLELGNKKYYAKKAWDEGIEILISKLALLVDIKCPKYFLVDSEYDTQYYVSEDIGNNEALFLTAFQFGIHSNSLYDIWFFLEKHYKVDAPRIMLEIVKIYLFDIFILNYDRSNNNWGFLVNADCKIKDVYIFDNEEAFDLSNRVELTSKLDGTEILKRYTEQRKDLFFSVDENMRELEYFLSTSSQEFIDLLMAMYDKLSPNEFEKSFEELENEGIMIDNKEEYITIYQINYEAIGKILKERGLRRWKRNI